MTPFKLLIATTIVLGVAAASDTAMAESLVFGQLPGPGVFNAITVNADNFNNTIDYRYEVEGVPVIDGTSGSGTFGTPVESWLIGFKLGPGFTGNAAHLDLTLTDFLPDTLSLGNFGITSNATPPGHPPPGYIGGGGRDAGLSDISTSFVPGHPGQLELLADLALPTSTVDNEYDLMITGLNATGLTSFAITGPVTSADIPQVPLPAALPLFAAAFLGLRLLSRRARRAEAAYRRATAV
jgi:hypothetical protein